jgi:predicted GIY-YIG superfamily endonuclease
MSDWQTAVYVARAVTDNRVLYVGMTENPQVRFAHHRRYSPWWGGPTST